MVGFDRVRHGVQGRQRGTTAGRRARKDGPVIPFICPSCGEFDIESPECTSCAHREPEVQDAAA
ncbi:hypothetical protein A5699_12160 [Mycobacterium sp. E802]|nr:hypothetical protein A5699_12160 [Mycobacterium sp. E802]